MSRSLKRCARRPHRPRWPDSARYVGVSDLSSHEDPSTNVIEAPSRRFHVCFGVSTTSLRRYDYSTPRAIITCAAARSSFSVGWAASVAAWLKVAPHLFLAIRFTRKGLRVRFILITSAIIALTYESAFAGPLDDLEKLEEFVTDYHREPAPKRVPAMLAIVVNGKVCESFTAIDPPHHLLLLAHAFGHMARGKGDLVRAYEAQFPGAAQPAKLFLLATLQICGDQDTVKQIATWQRDPKNSNLETALEAARRCISDPQRTLPRDRPARLPTDLDLLWGDFLITGEYPPVSRILDVFDEQDPMRPKIETLLKTNSGNSADLLQLLRGLKLIQPGTTDKLVEEDLDLAILFDKSGKSRNYVQAMEALHPVLQLSEEEWTVALVVKAVASWSLKSNMEQHPRLCELLNRHSKDRPAKSRRLVQLWLAEHDEPKK